MITAYKFLTPQLTSYHDFKWEIGKEYTINEPGNRLCSKRVFHCYNHPLLAEFVMPLHLFGKDYVLYKIEVPEFVNSDGLKFASKSQKVIEKIERPVITNEQRTEIAIRVAKLVCSDIEWNEWADKWLTGEDRSKESAYASYDYDAVDSDAASDAAYYAVDAAYYAVDAVDAAYSASYSAAYSAVCFADKDEFNTKLIEIIEMVCKR